MTLTITQSISHYLISQRRNQTKMSESFLDTYDDQSLFENTLEAMRNQRWSCKLCAFVSKNHAGIQTHSKGKEHQANVKSLKNNKFKTINQFFMEELN